MTKSLHSREYQTLRGEIKRLRNEAGISQRELAARLGVQPSWVAKVEVGERRVDIVEFYWLCKALKVNPVEAAANVVLKMSRGSKSRSVNN